MIKHLFKLIWNKKKQNFLLISEILISFMVIFAVFTLVVYDYQNYKKPMGIDYENVWAISYNNTLSTNNTDSLTQYYETLKSTIKSMPQVKAVAFASSNLPFFQNISQGGVTYHKKTTMSVNWYTVEDDYKEVFNVQVLEGRWFNKNDAAAKNVPVVINEELKKQLFGNGEAVGKLLGDDGDKHTMKKVIGVVQDIKVRGDYADPGYAAFSRTDTGSYHWLGRILVKVAPGTDAAFEGKLYKTLANYMKDSDIEIEHMVNKRTETNYFSLVPIIVLLVVACFLIINVALGLFGVLWYNINKRRGEIGLRRAVGATGKVVSTQLVAESLILTTLSLIVGCFFAVQFPLLNVFNLPAGIYVTAILLSVTFIYLLVFICSLYPGRQAAGVYPAVALHED